MPWPAQAAVRSLLRVTRLQYWPVRVRNGIARDARWTLFPWSAYWRGTHEPALQRWFLDLGDLSGWSCWDLGAHYGLYAIGFAMRTGPTGQVAAFEPNPLSFARLERHRRMNRLSWLQIFRAAVSDTAGHAEFYTYGNLESTTTHLPYASETPEAATHPIQVELTRLDDWVAAGRLRAPQLIKVDVEGHAHRALAGASQAIAQTRPIIVAGIHSLDEMNGCDSLLRPLGYQRHRIGGNDQVPNSITGHDWAFRPSLS